MRSIFLCTRAQTVSAVYPPETVAALQACAHLDPAVYTLSDLENAPQRFADVTHVFSTWGMPRMTEEEIRALLPQLTCVFYAAGSVQGFARPFLHCGVRVFSAWAANAVPVAEYTLAQILLAGKGFFHLSRLMHEGGAGDAHRLKSTYRGNYGAKIGLIGAGMIGQKVIELLRPYRLDVRVFDPFLSDEKAQALGVLKCPLHTLFETCQVVSNHLANNERTRGMLDAACFEALPPYATFINTARGAQVVEADLARVLAQRPDLTAVLDLSLIHI